MHQIEIDFDVFKALTVRRASEAVTYNDVIRKLLGLPLPTGSVPPRANSVRSWVVSNTGFPDGSEFMVEYKNKRYSGLVKDGKLELQDGARFSSPSAAAIHITGGNVNGWRFWKCRLPGTSDFVLIERLRGKMH